MDRVSSHVQMRGSIPVRWTQVTSATMPKPPIQVEHMDPSFSPSHRHFADLFARYGSPVLALNLVRQSEKTPRETLIGTQFAHLVRYLNAFLPREHAVRHLPLDYSALVRCRAAPARRRSRCGGLHTHWLTPAARPQSKRTRGKPSIMDTLRDIAEESLSLTGFFASRPPLRHRSRLAPPSHHRTLRVSATMAMEEAAGVPRPALPPRDALSEAGSAAERSAAGDGRWPRVPSAGADARRRRTAWWRADAFGDHEGATLPHNSLRQYQVRCHSRNSQNDSTLSTLDPCPCPPPSVSSVAQCRPWPPRTGLGRCARTAWCAPTASTAWTAPTSPSLCTGWPRSGSSWWRSASATTTGWCGPACALGRGGEASRSHPIASTP